jgi:hypothetical protein
MRLKPQRSEQVLIELNLLVFHYGVDGTLAFFRRRGQAGLEERLKECARSSDRLLAASAKELLGIVRAGRKIAAGTVTNSEEDRVSLQVVIPDVALLHVATAYGAENLPPGVWIDPHTGVLSGRLPVGASKGSPYKVRIWCHSRTRRRSDHKEATEFTWHVRPRVHLVD